MLVLIEVIVSFVSMLGLLVWIYVRCVILLRNVIVIYKIIMLILS